MNSARPVANADGAILFDPACAAQADAGWFAPGAWSARGLAERVGAGRGEAWFIQAPWGPSVLRHYRRGGLMAHLVDDQYVWAGAERTRCFAEYRLLEALAAKGLPVPQPVAARYVRRGMWYRADLITRRLVGTRSLAARLRAGDVPDLGEVGATLADFHAAGACHADLNAHNILLDDRSGGRTWLIDFDRGRLRAPGAWQAANLARLRRSLRKVLPGEPRLAAQWWPAIEDGYRRRCAAWAAAGPA